MPPLSQRPSTIDSRITELGGPSVMNVLVACGEALRRTPESPSARPHEEVGRALGALSLTDVESAVRSVDLAAVQRDLAVALSDAFEVGFADDPEERTLFAASAAAGLFARDRVESLLVAARLVAERDQAQALSAATSELRAKAHAVDGELSPKARSLTTINAERRRERDRLLAEHRAAAWWFTARADEGDDALIAALGALPGSARPQGLSADAERDLAGAALGKPSHESALSRLALGHATASEHAWLMARAAKDPALERAATLALDRSLERAETSEE